MKFQFNPTGSPFYSVGPFSFSEAQKEHDLELEKLPVPYLHQLLYGVNRGILLTEDKMKLINLIKGPTLNPPKDVDQDAVKKQAESIADPYEGDVKEMKSLLRQRIPTIQKAVTSFSMGKLRRLLELEEQSKGRKKLMAFIKELQQKHQEEVQQTTGVAPAKRMVPKDPFGSPLVTEVEESDQETVIFSQGLPEESETTPQEERE